MKVSDIKTGDLIFIEENKILAFEVNKKKIYSNKKVFSEHLREGFYLVIEEIDDNNVIVFFKNKFYFLNKSLLKESNIVL